MKKHRRSFILALLLCCVAVITMAGIYRRETASEEELQELVELSEADEDNAPSKEEVAAYVAEEDENKNNAADGNVSENPEETEYDRSDEVSGSSVSAGSESQMPESDTTDDSYTAEDITSSDAYAEEAMAEVSHVSLDFNEDSIITWPVQGDIIMEYSMDQPVYFATLEQYRYNPGILIQSEEGAMVYAGADAQITAIEESDELGTTITMDLGNDYSVTYGQLKSVNVNVGDTVVPGSLLALVAAPSKYYSLEGDHVYMEFTKDGVPIDPLDYLD